jgi:hypothetical protein
MSYEHCELEAAELGAQTDPARCACGAYLRNDGLSCPYCGVVTSDKPICESPHCTAEATEDRRGIMLCSECAAWLDRCFPNGPEE